MSALNEILEWSKSNAEAFSDIAKAKEWVDRWLKDGEDELAQLRNRIVELEKEAEEHPYHEACPKCLRTKELLRKRVDKLEARTTWQDISSAPQNTNILVLDKSGMWLARLTTYSNNEKIWSPLVVHFPTHWMPLPSAPTEETPK